MKDLEKRDFNEYWNDLIMNQLPYISMVLLILYRMI
jgi:hypothetical protein